MFFAISLRRGVWEIGGRGWKELEAGGLGGEGMVGGVRRRGVGESGDRGGAPK